MERATTVTMMSRVRRHIRSNLIAYIALAMAISFTPIPGYASHLIVRTSDIVDGAVTGVKIRDEAVTTRKIRDEAVAAKNLSPKLGQPPFASRKSEAIRLVGASGQPAFENGWSNWGFASTGFYKDSQGVVHLRGSLTPGGSSFSVAFTLPVGYRPSAQLFMPAAHGDAGGAALLINPSGTVQVKYDGTCACAIGIDGLSFRP